MGLESSGRLLAGWPPDEAEKVLTFQENLLYTAVVVDSAWKFLAFDGQGFWMAQKRLSKGRLYRGRVVTVEDVAFIRGLIAANTGTSRRTLSKKLCEAWGWRQANGALCDMVCRGLLLMLERSGQIALPLVTYKRHNPLAHRARPAPVLLDQTQIEGRLKDLGPIEFEQVRRTADEPLFNSLMEQYHYLGYEQPVGEHLKYVCWAQGRPVACLAWSSAPRHLGSRDRYIGWSAEARRRNIRFVAYNTRFLILPWVQVPHLVRERLARPLGQRRSSGGKLEFGQRDWCAEN